MALNPSNSSNYEQLALKGLKCGKTGPRWGSLQHFSRRPSWWSPLLFAAIRVSQLGHFKVVPFSRNGDAICSLRLPVLDLGIRTNSHFKSELCVSLTFDFSNNAQPLSHAVGNVPTKCEVFVTFYSCVTSVRQCIRQLIFFCRFSRA